MLGEGVRLFERLGDDSIKLKFLDAITTAANTTTRQSYQARTTA